MFFLIKQECMLYVVKLKNIVSKLNNYEWSLKVFTSLINKKTKYNFKDNCCKNN